MRLLFGRRRRRNRGASSVRTQRRVSAHRTHVLPTQNDRVRFTRTSPITKYLKQTGKFVKKEKLTVPTLPKIRDLSELTILRFRGKKFAFKRQNSEVWEIRKEKICRERKKRRQELMRKTKGKGASIKKASWDVLSKEIKC